MEKEKEQEQNEKKQQKSRRRRRKRRSKEQEEKMEMEMQINCQPTEALVTGGDQQLQSEEHIVDIPEQQITDPEAAEDSFFMRYSGSLSFLENFILGPNQGNQIWRLRLLSGISLYIATVVGFLFYLGDLPQVQHQALYHYQMVMLITTVGAPIVVAAIGLFVSFWFPNRTNWITGSSVANFIMLCGQAIYWAQKWGTGY